MAEARGQANEPLLLQLRSLLKNLGMTSTAFSLAATIGLSAASSIGPPPLHPSAALRPSLTSFDSQKGTAGGSSTSTEAIAL